MKQLMTLCWFALILSISVHTNIAEARQMGNTNKTLSENEKSIIAIASLSATGDLPTLKTALITGLEAGLTINEIKEVLVHLYAYCGFPRSLNAINTFKALLEERKNKGATDKEGKEIVTVNNTTDKYEQGRKTLEILTKMPQPKPAPGFGEFAPRIDMFLKEHLFADVFSSEVLNYKQRELVTISTLAAMPGVEAQLQSHINIGKNTGITESQLNELASLIEKYVNRTQANIVRKLIDQPTALPVEPDMIVRVSEIEIIPKYLEEYRSILKAEAAASVKVEPGVIAIFPMYQKENPAQVRIVEIYANNAAYQSHLKTPHFQHYKTGTATMVKSLKLVDMDNVDKEAMLLIFEKLK